MLLKALGEPVTDSGRGPFSMMETTVSDVMSADQLDNGSAVLPLLSFAPHAADADVRRPLVRWIDPLTDPRWDDLLAYDHRSSVFHTRAWLSALSRTFGYRSVALTTCAREAPLLNAIVFCEIESWLTGRRLVSLPFSDHCEPLVSFDDMPLFATEIERVYNGTGWRYFETRPLSPGYHCDGGRDAITYTFHQLDLSPSLTTLFNNFHKSSTQRKIRRAQREAIECREGKTARMLDEFYDLFIVTRRRHGVPPHPRAWFQNLMTCFGERFKLRIAYQKGRPIAGIITLQHKNSLVYKYGASDPACKRLGGMHLLFWESIREAKESGLDFLDLGRSNPGQDGLITFKRRWGSTEHALTYSRYPLGSNPMHFFDVGTDWRASAAQHVIQWLPRRVLAMLGTVLYKHAG